MTNKQLLCMFLDYKLVFCIHLLTYRMFNTRYIMYVCTYYVWYVHLCGMNKIFQMYLLYIYCHIVLYLQICQFQLSAQLQITADSL